MESERKKELKQNLEWNIKAWAGVDVQIMHRFRLVPTIREGSKQCVLEIFDSYTMTYLQSPEADGTKKNRWFLNCLDALAYLRGLYREPLSDDEEYDIIIKRKEVKDDEPEV